jgi:hypothetical protein
MPCAHFGVTETGLAQQRRPSGLIAAALHVAKFTGREQTRKKLSLRAQSFDLIAQIEQPRLEQRRRLGALARRICRGGE